MDMLLNISLLQKLRVRHAAWIALGYLVVLSVSLNNYLVFLSMNFILGSVALVFVWEVRDQHKRSYRYAVWTLIFLVLDVFMPVKTLLYFTICFSLLFLVECFYGKLNILAPFIIILISPVFQYAVNTFSFPIRLGLSKLAGAVFSMAGMDTVVKGNMIFHNGHEFSIDPGCMGLSMMESSLLLGAILLAYYGGKAGRKTTGIMTLSYFAILALLNVAANLFRIILLVHFAIMPGTASHEITGIACLLLYVFIPAVWMVKFFVGASINTQHQPGLLSKTRAEYLSKPHSVTFISQSGMKRPFRLLPIVHWVLLGSVAALAIHVQQSDTYKKADLSVLKSEKDILASVYAPGIVKVQSKEALVYIKYLRGFYDTDHNPMLCWKGSGYEFEQVQQQTIQGNKIYTALLVNGNDKLYSAWWYGNGKTATISQFKWRWDMAKGSRIYALVNITCTTQKQLATEIRKAIHEKKLSQFFSRSFYH